MADIQIRGDLVDNDSADVLRYWGWRDITAPMDIAAALEAANGEDVTVLINSPGGSMPVGLEIRSMLRRYKGKVTALIQGYAASSATLAISACDEIQCESGALCCYHNPTSYASGDHNDMAHMAESLRNARDCIIEVYRARKSVKSAEELAELMDKDIFITPTQAMEYGLIDKIVSIDDEVEEPQTPFVASSTPRMRVTNAMREKYQAHVAEQREADENEKRANCALARLRALAEY